MIAAISIETYHEIERRAKRVSEVVGIQIDQELFNSFCNMLLEYHERHGRLPEVSND